MIRCFSCAACVFLLGATLGCKSASPYAVSARYAPTNEEAAALSGARDYDPIEASRDPAAWRGSSVALFGVVTKRAAGPSGSAALTLSARALVPRSACTSAKEEETCRVTVGDRELGAAHVIVALRPEDDMGELAVGIGSLVRVVGKLGADVAAGDGAPVVRATFYRHWPRRYYVTR